MFFWVFLVIGYGNLWWFNVEKMMVFGYGWLKGEVLFFLSFWMWVEIDVGHGVLMR
jgi:hypothetical protein